MLMETLAKIKKRFELYFTTNVKYNLHCMSNYIFSLYYISILMAKNLLIDI